MNQQRLTWLDGTQLLCYRGPDSPCPKNTFKHLKWEDAIGGCLPLQLVKRKESKAHKWYFIMLNRASKEYGSTFKTHLIKTQLCVSVTGARP